MSDYNAPVPPAMWSMIDPVEQQKQSRSPSVGLSNGGNGVCDDRELAQLSDRVQKLAQIKQAQQQELAAAQRKMACAEWEHAMSEAVRKWYEMRCEDSAAAKALEEAQARREASKIKLREAEENAQLLHQRKPDACAV